MVCHHAVVALLGHGVRQVKVRVQVVMQEQRHQQLMQPLPQLAFHVLQVPSRPQELAAAAVAQMVLTQPQVLLCAWDAQLARIVVRQLLHALTAQLELTLA